LESLGPTVKSRAVLTALEERRRWVARRDLLREAMRRSPVTWISRFTEYRYLNAQIEYYDSLIQDMKESTQKPPSTSRILGGLST